MWGGERGESMGPATDLRTTMQGGSSGAPSVGSHWPREGEDPRKGRTGDPWSRVPEGSARLGRSGASGRRALGCRRG